MGAIIIVGTRETDVRKFVQEADVQIYAIGLFEPDGGRRRKNVRARPSE